MTRLLLLLLLSCCIAGNLAAQKKTATRPVVIAYYAGRPTMVDSFEVEKLTHIIFSFCHLNGNKLFVSNARDTLTIQRMVALKQRNPQLKIILSLGGWGGCKDCSPVFATSEGREAFAVSVKELNNYFGTDGIDLDWEYPAIAGYPGHAYSPSDKPAFTDLVKQLRKQLGRKHEISFAAGGFNKFIDSSIEWKKVMPVIDRVNLMSYDLVHGASSISGHHTPLYSTPEQEESTDNGVKRLIAVGVPANKIVIGAAFYGRLFEVRDTARNGLYQSARFDHGFSYRSFTDTINTANGFTIYWDKTAQAPYAFNPQRKLLATYDDNLSVTLKTQYVQKKGLNGIMFWQLVDDRFNNGLLSAIHAAIEE
jgi:chitinase